MRLKQIDGLKMLFLCGIIANHYKALANHNLEKCVSFIPNTVYNYGYLGVEFFFIISGFLISYKYRDQLHNREIGIGDYTKKRFISLYPMFLVSNILGACVELVSEYLTNEKSFKCRP